MMTRDPREVHRRLTEAAAPYGLRAERTEHSPLPDLVLLSPSDGRPVVRVRYFEPDGGSPQMRGVYPPEVSSAQEGEIEAHLARRMMSVIAAVFSPTAWLSLPDLLADSSGPGSSPSPSPSRRRDQP